MKLRARGLCLLLIPASVSAWAAASDAAASASTDSTPPEIRNQNAIDALVQMGNYLRSLPKFRVDAAVERDVVLESGQKIKALGTSSVEADGHSMLRASVTSDTIDRQYFYNGKDFTQYSPTLKYYTTVKAPGKLLDALDEFQSHYGIRIPMEDLFLFGSDQDQLDAIKTALFVGTSSVNGQQCDHFAYRQPGADWQLWIAHSGNPLPCKLVITTTDDASEPEYSATYRWNLSPSFNAATFTFHPGKGDTSIPIKKIND